MNKSNTSAPCMPLEKAESFVKKINEDIFPNGKVEEVENIYTENVIGHWGESTFGLSEIKQRIIAIKEHTKECHFKVNQVYVFDDFITFTCNQSWVTKDNHFYDSIIFIIYKIRDEKVCEVWGMSDIPIKNYKDVNLNFSKNMLQFELNNKSKQEFMRKLFFAEKMLHNITLNNTERECLYYYFHGFSAKETAIQIDLSYRTVEAYIAQIKEKFACQNKHQLRKKLFPSNI